MEQFSEAAKKRPMKTKPSRPWTFREKTSVWASLAMVIILMTIPFVDRSIKYNRSIEARLESWKSDYNLTDATVEKLRVIEFAFHRFESPFSMSRQPSATEAETHSQEIAKHLDPVHAEVFLEREASKHTKSHTKNR